jgi:8-oxo-dGTP pyrophosphatase MutT (NUDIX family)
MGAARLRRVLRPRETRGVSEPSLREWTVAGGLVLRGDEVLLVRNVRRGGTEDWSTPGGVIDEADATPYAGLTREVVEETGIVVREWSGPVYEVRADAPDLGWRLRCEVHLAVDHDGDITIDDPDGIVVEARFWDRADACQRLDACPAWVREPLAEWLRSPWPVGAPGEHRVFQYDVHGASRAELRVERRE